MNFADKVREMRAAQKAYFAADYGSSEKWVALALSKRLEAEVDRMLAGDGAQLDMFGGEKGQTAA